MKFSIGLLISSCLLYFFHYLVRLFSPDNSNELISLLMGLGLIGMILSVACFFMNRGMITLKNRKRPIYWMILSAIAFVLFTGYVFVFCLIERAREVGIVFY